MAVCPRLSLEMLGQRPDRPTSPRLPIRLPPSPLPANLPARRGGPSCGIARSSSPAGRLPRARCKLPGRLTPLAATRSRSASSAAAVAAREAVHAGDEHQRRRGQARRHGRRLRRPRAPAAIRGIKSQHATKVDVPKERQFVGFDAYKDLLADRVRPRHPGHAAGLPAAALRGGGGGRQARLHGEAGGGRCGRRAQGAGRPTKKRRRRTSAVGVGLQRRHERKYMETDQGDSGRRDRRHRPRPRLLERRQPWWQGAAGQARPKWSTRCATGTTSTGSAAITSSSSTSTTWTSSTGSRTAIRSRAQGLGGCQVRDGRTTARSSIITSSNSPTPTARRCSASAATSRYAGTASRARPRHEGLCRRQRREDLRRRRQDDPRLQPRPSRTD